MITVILFGVIILLAVILGGVFHIIWKVLYFLCAGLPGAIILLFFGLVFTVTIIGIPIARALFHLAGVILFPWHRCMC